MRRRGTRILLAALAVALIGATVQADQWNDKTILTFSEPVMVPNATLPAGTYVFKLADMRGSRHLVQIFDEGEQRLITTTQSIPTKRTKADDDVLLRFNPTDQGGPVAVKAWFPAGSTFGHEFVYPEQQARQIAERTKAVVLSLDVPDSDLQKGTLRTVSPSGDRTEWRGDEAVLREWSAWQKSRTTAGTSASADERRQASATVVQTDRDAMRVSVNDLEEMPRKYIGQRVSVDAEVEEVFGPRLFTIDESNWGDLDGELLVFMPTTLAAAVREDDRITVTGTVQSFVLADVEREWGWLGLDPEVEVDFNAKPVLKADRLVGGDNNVAMVIEVQPSTAAGGGAGASAETAASTRGVDRGAATGTSGRSASTDAGAPVANLATLADGDEDLVGRSVSLQQARIAGVDPQRGYFLSAGAEHLFVLPARTETSRLQVGDEVRIDGSVLRMPGTMDDRLKAPGRLNDDIYVYATNLAKR